MTTKKTKLGMRPQRFTLAKGLTRPEAFRRAKNRATRDFRGFAYDPDTGKTELI